VLAVRGQPSSMALGRTLFIFFNHALYSLAHKLFHLPTEDAYLLFKYAVICLSPFVVIACWALTREVTNSNRTATIAALLITASPPFVVYSGQVMTDVPSLLFVVLALLMHLRGLRLRSWWMMMLGAALLGAGVNVRETAMFYAPWLLLAPFVCGWKFGRRELALIALSCLVFALVAFGPFALWFWTDASGYRAAWYNWRDSGQAEAARHPVTLLNVLPFLFYSFILGPIICVALPPAIWKEWRERGLTALLLLALFGVWANFLLFFNYSTTINWRYFLTGLPTLVPLVADYLLRSQTTKLGDARRAFWSTVLGIAFVMVMVAIYANPTSRESTIKRALTKDYRTRLALLPSDAVVMAGAQTVAVTYWRGIGMGQWTEIGTGAGWPAVPLDAAIESYLNEGRRVFLDQDPRWWSPCGWQLDETLQLVRLETRFHFRKVSDTIYEIRPPEDESAHDTPNLQNLLPENRPAETKRCLGLRPTTK